MFVYILIYITCKTITRSNVPFRKKNHISVPPRKTEEEMGSSQCPAAGCMYIHMRIYTHRYVCVYMLFIRLYMDTICIYVYIYILYYIYIHLMLDGETCHKDLPGKSCFPTFQTSRLKPRTSWVCLIITS